MKFEALVINNYTKPRKTMTTFNLPTNENSIIKVIGVGGGGSNAVNHMFRQGIKGVDFVVCNTDQQAIDISPVPTKIVLGASLTKGRGAGSIPEVGKNAAIENIEDIKRILSNDTQMVFITAGMGGGTGTGAAPIIAQTAREMGILTVGIVTVPFVFEGKKRKAQAEAGLEEMKKSVDTLLVICNDKLREMYGNLKLGEAFGHADDVLTTAAKGIADIINTTMHINTDFADITTVMKDSGVAIMGTGFATGEGRAVKAIEQAMHSPLLNDSNIKGARYVLLNIMCGNEEITMDELGEITDFIQDAAGQTAEIIKGYGVDESLGNQVKVTLIATGFTGKVDMGIELTTKKSEKIIHSLVAETNVTTAPAVNTFKTSVETTVNASKELSNEPTLINNSSTDVAEQKQVTIEFEVTNAPVSNESNIEFNDSVEEENTIEKVQEDDMRKRAQERILKLKELSYKLKTPGGLSELENEPAYIRRSINLNDVPHSSESQVSRYTLSETDDKKVEIKANNSFLHDNVD